MSQFNQGLVKWLSADPNRFVLQGALTTGNIFPGNLVKFDGETNIWLTVASIVDATTFDTVENYPGVKPADTFLPYVVTRDFTPNLAIPEATQGDRNTADIYTRGMRRIDQLAGPQIARLTNGSGGVLAAGDVVGISTAADQAVVLADTLASLRAYAVCLDASVAASATGLFVLGGVILAKAQGAIARGRYVRKSATTKALEDAGVTMTDAAVPPAGTIGVSLAAAASGFCSVLLFGGAAGRSGYYEATLTSGDSAAITGTGNQTFNKTHPLPAGILDVAGAAIDVEAAGRYTSDASGGTVVFAIRLGGNNLFVLGLTVPNSQTNQVWLAHGSGIVRSTGVSGVVQRGVGYGGVVNSGFGANVSPGNFVANLTAALTVDVQANPDNAGNSFVMESLVIRVYPTVGATF